MKTGQKARTVVVTGGSSGIGKAIAQSFAAEDQVVILGRNAQKLEQAAAEIGRGVVWCAADVGRRWEVERTVGCRHNSTLGVWQFSPGNPARYMRPAVCKDQLSVTLRPISLSGSGPGGRG